MSENEAPRWAELWVAAVGKLIPAVAFVIFGAMFLLILFGLSAMIGDLMLYGDFQQWGAVDGGNRKMIRSALYGAPVIIGVVGLFAIHHRATRHVRGGSR